MARLFLAEYPRSVAQLKDAIRQGNAATVEKVAHRLKGAVGNFACKKSGAAAEAVETLGREGDIRAASDACATLESELALFSEELKRVALKQGKKRTKAGGIAAAM